MLSTIILVAGLLLAQVSPVVIQPGQTITIQAAPVPTPSPAPTPANGPYTYAGCSMFPGTIGGNSGGWYDTDISTAPVGVNSASYISNFNSHGGAAAGGLNFFGGTNGPTAQEVINTPTLPFLYNITEPGMGGYTTNILQLPGPPTIYPGSGAPSSLYIESNANSGGDGHYHVLSTTTCQSWTAGYTSFANSLFNVWNADVVNTNQPQGLVRSHQAGGTGGGSETCCGVAEIAFLVKPGELQLAEANGTGLHHALGWSAPSNEKVIETTNEKLFVAPATQAQNNPYTCSPTPCMPYGIHLRLHASFNDSGFAPGAKAIAETLKHYGMYLADTSCCMNIMYPAQDWSGIDINTLWNSTDESQINSIHITDFDTIDPIYSNSPN